MIDEIGKSAAGNREFDETCERYLLGELPESEREQFEEDYFADDELFERYLAVKDDLLDLYARGQLSVGKQARFAGFFQSTAQLRQQATETRDFVRTITLVSAKAQDADPEGWNAQPKTSSLKSLWHSPANPFKFHKFALASGFMSLLLISALVAGVIFTYFMFDQQPEPARNEHPIQQENRREQTNQQSVSAPLDGSRIGENNNIAPILMPTDDNLFPRNVNRTPNNTNQIYSKNKQPSINPSVTPKPKLTKPIEQPTQLPQIHIASIWLSPFASRSVSETNTLRLSTETKTVRLDLNFKRRDLRSYSATITTVSGVKIFQQEQLQAMIQRSAGEANASVSVQLASIQLRQQDYIVTLKGKTEDGKTEAIAEYHFRVDRSPTQNTQTPKPTP